MTIQPRWTGTFGGIMRAASPLAASISIMALAAACLLGAVPARAQGVTVAILPADTTVTLGSEFDVTLRVTVAGSAINAFDAYVGFDPTALTMIPRSPISLQEGALFKSACSNRFHTFHAGSNRDTISDVLLCNGVSVTGPGELYRLHFKATGTIGATVIRFLPGLQFYNAGLFVNPAISSDATIHVVCFFNIAASAGPGGSISPSGSVAVNCGASQSFSILPNPCFHVANVLVDGVSVGSVTSYTFTNVSANHTIAASFALDTYTIAASAGPGGAISPGGNVTVNCGANQAFNIAASPCNHIADVLVDGVSVGAVAFYSFASVAANHTIAASFALNTYTILASAGPDGSITPSGSVALDCGSSQAFGFAPNPCFHVASVLVDGVSVGAVTSYTFASVVANHTIAASFALNTYAILASAGPGGSIVPAGNVAVNCGADAAFGVAPGPCYHVADVLVDGASAGAVASYTFTNVSANHSIAASFTLDTYAIAASAGPGGTISPSGSVAVSCGADQAFAIAAGAHYAVQDVVVDGASQGALAAYTFSNVVATHTIEAAFVIDRFTLAVSVTGAGTVLVSPLQPSYAYGTPVALSASPVAGWSFAGWGGDTAAIANPLALVMTRNRGVTATFADTSRPVVQVLAPNGGETVMATTIAPINWSATDNAAVASVDVSLSRSGPGGPFEVVATGIANTGTYAWAVTGPATADAFIRVAAHDAGGNIGADLSDGPFGISVPSTGVVSGVVTELALSSVWPNPLLREARFSFALPLASRVRLSVIDVQGREVRVLRDDDLAAGRYQSGLGDPLSAGLYFLRLQVAGRNLVRRFVVGS